MDLTRLRDYQLEDAKFLAAHKTAAACFNEQRTGKTPTALAACYLRNCQRILITCPASGIYPWVDEYQKWYGQPCIPYVGTPRQREKLLSQWDHGLVISYDTLKETKRSHGEWSALLAARPDAHIIDEAHRIKHRKSAQAQAVFHCIDIPYRLALTGTPAPGKSHEVWSILHYIDPVTFSSYWGFIEEYYITGMRYNATGNKYIDIIGIKPEKRKELQLILNKMATLRKRKEVMPWLPDKDYQPVRLPLTKDQKQYLNELEQMWQTEHIETIGVLDRLVRYRQICLHPQLLDLKGNSPKMDWILQYLKDYPDRPTIIFSKFTSFIKILAASCKKAGVIIGETPKVKRQEYCKLFQSGKLNLLLINTDVGKEVLTLDRAECIIFTDKYPPVGDIEQAEDRFVATTKDKADKPHLIIELMMKDSYDEVLYQLIKERKTEADIINNYKAYLREGE
jgi:SNF2 family DNA or RNA helicase